MTATNHAVTGIAIAVALHNPWALPLAFLAHFVEDIVPHSELKLKEVWGDLALAALAIIILTFFLKGHTAAWIVLGSAFLCASPDLVWGWRYFKFKDVNKAIYAEPISWFSRWHQKIQWSETRPGISVEVLWLAVLVGYIIIKR